MNELKGIAKRYTIARFVFTKNGNVLGAPAKDLIHHDILSKHYGYNYPYGNKVGFIRHYTETDEYHYTTEDDLRPEDVERLNLYKIKNHPVSYWPIDNSKDFFGDSKVIKIKW